MTASTFTLRLLGGARLERDGARVEGEPGQRHRIALLALLALSPRGRAPREKLTALLWPEHAPQQARHLLNMSVYVLRKALGKSAILSEGDELRLDVDRLGCDVRDLKDALADGRTQDAVALYAGPFMDGHFLDDASDFDTWQEARRAELEDAYCAALSRLADDAQTSGATAEAIRWRKEALRARPTDASAAVALMELLEASGDRAGALRVAQGHETEMAERFEAEPNPGVQALARRIRQAPEPVRRAQAAAPAEGTSRLGGQSAVPSGGPARPPSPPPPPEDETDAAPVVPGVGRLSGAGARVLATVVIVSSAALLAYRAATPPAADGTDTASVAVLPFADMSEAGDQAYFSDGLSEELLNVLAQTPGLRVAARSSSFQFRGDGVDIRAVGRRLAVGSVVEGSVRVEGDQLRVTAQLIDAASGYHLWSEQYDRPMRDVFAVQREIAHSIATALNEELAIGPVDTASATPARAAAYPLYLRGRHEWRMRTEGGMRSALAAFQEAISIDPTFAAAYAGLADVYQLLPDYADMAAADGLARAKTAALRAIALDSTLADAHASLGAVLDDYDRDRQGAESAYRRAIELNPGYATARHWLAIHLADELRFDEALEQIEQARRLDPLSSIVSTAVGAILYFARDYDGSAAEYEAVLDLEPDFALAWALLGRTRLLDGRVDEAVSSLGRSVELSRGDPSYRAVYAAALAEAGQVTEARAIADELLSAHPDGYVPYCELASAYIRLGDEAQALELFDHAWDRRDPALKHILVEPLYDAIRPHPEFRDLMRRAGFDVP